MIGKIGNCCIAARCRRMANITGIALAERCPADVPEMGICTQIVKGSGDAAMAGYTTICVADDCTARISPGDWFRYKRFAAWRPITVTVGG